jgi:hypothetical protein
VPFRLAVMVGHGRGSVRKWQSGECRFLKP